jgi:arylsulfatase A-like enzyme
VGPTTSAKEPLNDKYGPDDYLTDRQLLRMRALYAGEIAMAGYWLGNFLQKAHDHDLMQNTLLIVISDHGHALGEHGYTGKPPYALWSELTDTVFFMRYPEGKRAGEASDHFASTHDVAPTMLGILGIEPPVPMDGQNLSVLFEGKYPRRGTTSRPVTRTTSGPATTGTWCSLATTERSPGSTTRRASPPGEGPGRRPRHGREDVRGVRGQGCEGNAANLSPVRRFAPRASYA